MSTSNGHGSADPETRGKPVSFANKGRRALPPRGVGLAIVGGGRVAWFQPRPSSPSLLCRPPWGETGEGNRGGDLGGLSRGRGGGGGSRLFFPLFPLVLRRLLLPPFSGHAPLAVSKGNPFNITEPRWGTEVGRPRPPPPPLVPRSLPRFCEKGVGVGEGQLGLSHEAATPNFLWEVNRESGKRSLFLLTGLQLAAGVVPTRGGWGFQGSGGVGGKGGEGGATSLLHRASPPLRPSPASRWVGVASKPLGRWWRRLPASFPPLGGEEARL